MRHAKTDSVKHIDNINKVSGPSNCSALIMRTSCPGRAHTLSDSGTVVPVLKMYFEITHAIARDIKLVREKVNNHGLTWLRTNREPSQDNPDTSLATPARH